MHIKALGDWALLIADLGDLKPWTVAGAIGDAQIAGVVEATSSYDTVGVYLEPGAVEADLEAQLISLISQISPTSEAERVEHAIPVCYDLGDDLHDAAGTLAITAEKLVELHCGTSYTCFAIGFQPGFPYLGPLPEALQGIPRRPQPRVRVPAGSVAIATDQTGIYPAESPGGWTLIGRTPLTIVDVKTDYFPIKAGDTVRFLPITLVEYERLLRQRL